MRLLELLHGPFAIAISNALEHEEVIRLKNMLADGATSFIEVGPGTVLQGLIKKVDREVETQSA